MKIKSKMNKTKTTYLTLAIFLLIVSPLILAHESDLPHDEPTVIDSSSSDLDIPPNLQKLLDYQDEQAQFYFSKLSILIAFLAGVIGLLTPCSLAILPAYFAYTFREKKEITKKTFFFFLGFAPVFVVLGLLATYLGKSISLFQQNNKILVIISGVILLILGAMALFGRGFSGIQINKKADSSNLGVFLFGILFAVGFTACVGPILVGILLIAGVLQSYLYAGILMLSYSFGLFVPLLLLSIGFDKYNFNEKMSKWNKRMGFPITNVISGLILIILGFIFIIYGGTYIFDYIGLGSVTVFIYSIQTKILSLPYINIVSLVVLAGFLYVLWRFFKKSKKKRNVKS